MNDDKFYLSVVEVRRYVFPPAMRGYDRQKVEEFRALVAEEFERLTRVNLELEAQVKSLHEQLRGFRERDKALNDALISAQQLRSEIREQADRESQLILREARAEGDRLLDEQRGEVRRLQQEIGLLDRVRRTYLSQLRTMVERQLAEIDAAEASAQQASEEAAASARANKVTPAWLDTLIKE
jgi:cell division septum initiation protein DivIVA